MKKIENITEKLEKGVVEVFDSERYKTYLDCMSRFYKYSANNCLLIAMQFPEASLIAGYQAWQHKFKRQVKKGAKAIKILAPCMHKKIVEKDGEETEVVWVSYRVVNVFDVSQTDGEKLPTFCDRLIGNVDDYDLIKENIINLSPVPVVFEKINGGAAGFYSSLTKDVHIDNRLSEQQTIKTLIHEIAHAKLHDADNGNEKEADRRKREVQAESVAYTVCQWLGVDTSSYSFEYIASWASGKAVKELEESIETIQKTSRELIDALVA